MTIHRHTPGPWNLDWRDGNEEQYSLLLPARRTPTEINEPIAVIPHDDVTDEGIAEVAANARLIKAAPKMLDALGWAVKALAVAEESSPGLYINALSIVKSAISEATQS